MSNTAPVTARSFTCCCTSASTGAKSKDSLTAVFFDFGFFAFSVSALEKVEETTTSRIVLNRASLYLNVISGIECVINRTQMQSEGYLWTTLLTFCYPALSRIRTTALPAHLPSCKAE